VAAIDRDFATPVTLTLGLGDGQCRRGRWVQFLGIVVAVATLECILRLAVTSLFRRAII